MILIINIRGPGFLTSNRFGGAKCSNTRIPHGLPCNPGFKRGFPVPFLILGCENQWWLRKPPFSQLKI